MKRKTAQLFDLVFKRLIRLSSQTITQFINGLFSTDYPIDSTVEYPSTENVSPKLKKLSSDTILIINSVHVYHVEAQISDDENIALRVFEYGFVESQRTKEIDEDIITLRFPHAKIIYLETTSRTPDSVTLRLVFPDGTTHDYKVETYKFLNHTIKELEQQNMALLLPFYILKLRHKAARTKNHEKLLELSKEMEGIIAELDATVERCEKAGLLSENDMQEVFSLMDRMYEELYTAEEFKGADKMIKDRILTHAEEAAEKKALEIILKMKKENFTDEIIAKIVEFPIERIRAIQV